MLENGELGWVAKRQRRKAERLMEKQKREEERKKREAELGIFITHTK